MMFSYASHAETARWLASNNRPPHVGADALEHTMKQILAAIAVLGMVGCGSDGKSHNCREVMHFEAGACHS